MNTKLEINQQLKKIKELFRFQPSSDTLMGGSLGLCIFLFWSSKDSAYAQLSKKVQHIIEHIFEQLSAEKSDLRPLSYGYGLVGLGYVLQKLKFRSLLPLEIDQEFFIDLDEFISGSVEEQINANNTGFLHGAAGCIYYLQSRASEVPELLPKLEEILEHLYSSAIIDDAGLRFRSGDLHLSMPGLDQHYNLSLNNGLIGVLLVLITVYEKHGDIGNVKEMVEKGIAFILSMERAVSLKKERVCYFPTIVSPEKEIRALKKEFYASRLGWCIGDLPASLLLCRAGKVFENHKWQQKGMEVAEFTLNRKTQQLTKVDDNDFCHGAAGIASVYKRLYQITGNQKFYTEGYKYWIEEMPTYLIFTTAEHENNLLHGVAGQLVVLQDMTNESSDWQDIFLL